MQDMLLKFLACRDVGAVLIEEFKGLKLYWMGVAAAGGCYLMQGGGRLEASFPWAALCISEHIRSFVGTRICGVYGGEGAFIGVGALQAV